MSAGVSFFSVLIRQAGPRRVGRRRQRIRRIRQLSRDSAAWLESSFELAFRRVDS
jgi:hypothetical protein